MKCSTGPTPLFPEVEQCPNEAVTYIFGVPYCRTCANQLVQLHAIMNGESNDLATRTDLR